MALPVSITVAVVSCLVTFLIGVLVGALFCHCTTSTKQRKSVNSEEATVPVAAALSLPIYEEMVIKTNGKHFELSDNAAYGPI